MKIPEDRTLDTVTPDEWNVATLLERNLFMREQGSRGMASLVCLGCGFPAAYGRARCEACP